MVDEMPFDKTFSWLAAAFLQSQWRAWLNQLGERLDAYKLHD